MVWTGKSPCFLGCPALPLPHSNLGGVEMDAIEKLEEVEETLAEIMTIAQLVKEIVTESEENDYIRRSLSTIEKMVRSVCEKDMQELKKLIT